ncbi:MAG: hypothetical protein JOY99_03175 [Sphingomonadaceae bacterium]|nr:hypothetical protein [Sphingomonadaceae bacterium]
MLAIALCAAPAAARPWERGPDAPHRPMPDRPVADRPGIERQDYERPPMPPRRSDQDYARDAMRAGAIRPLREIQQAWRMDMPGYDFIGSEYDPDMGSYRLKFMRGGEVVWVDVDGRGREIRRSGH